MRYKFYFSHDEQPEWQWLTWSNGDLRLARATQVHDVRDELKAKYGDNVLIRVVPVRQRRKGGSADSQR